MIFQSLLLFVIVPILVYLHLRQRYSSLPPGPWGLPIVGYLPWLNPVAPYASLASLVPKYGKVFSVRLGEHIAVVICDVQVMKRAFSKQVFSGRPHLYLFQSISKGLGLVFSEGNHWAEQRKWVRGVLRRQSLAGPGLAATLEEPVRELMVDLEGVGESWVDIQPILLHIISNIMNKAIFGMTYTKGSSVGAQLQTNIDQGSKLLEVTGPVNFLPWLRHLPSIARDIACFKRGQVNMFTEYDRNMKERQDMVSKGEKAICVTDEFLKEMEQREASEEDVKSFTLPQLQHLQADIFGAGTDTTIATIQWTLLELSCPQNQHIQAALHKQIDLDRPDKSPTQLDDDLPLLRASILETHRLRSIGPMGVPHASLGTAQLEDWVLPKGTILMPLQWFMNRDPDLWDNPNDFNPARFLTMSEKAHQQRHEKQLLIEDKEISLEVLTEGQLQHNPNLLPFQTGMRRCLGEELGKSAVFLILSRILQRFSITLEHGYHVDQIPKNGITSSPHPFKVKFTPRNNINTAASLNTNSVHYSHRG